MPNSKRKRKSCNNDRFVSYVSFISRYKSLMLTRKNYTLHRCLFFTADFGLCCFWNSKTPVYHIDSWFTGNVGGPIKSGAPSNGLTSCTAVRLKALFAPPVHRLLRSFTKQYSYGKVSDFMVLFQHYFIYIVLLDIG